MPRTAGWREDEHWGQALRVGVHCARVCGERRVVSLRESGFWGKK